MIGVQGSWTGLVDTVFKHERLKKICMGLQCSFFGHADFGRLTSVGHLVELARLKKMHYRPLSKSNCDFTSTVLCLTFVR